MAQIAIFIKDDCPQCPLAKEVGAQLSEMDVDVKYYDVDTPTGLARAMKLSVRSLPTIMLLVDSVEQLRWNYPNIPPKEEIMNHID